MKRIKQLCGAMLLLIASVACEKGDYVKPFREFVKVSFDANKTALRDNGEAIYIAARYNGYPIEWSPGGDGKIKVVEGEGRFEFYDSRNDRIVADTLIDVIPGAEQVFYLFQPTLESPVTFIDPVNAQAGEEAAPEGYIKLKVANYAQDVIPFSQTDVKVIVLYYDENWNEIRADVGVIENVAKAVEEASYVLLPDGVPDGVTDYQYIFEFIDGVTGQPLLNYGGTDYWTTTGFTPMYMDPLPMKNVFTLYFVTQKGWGEAPHFIKNGDDFYEIQSKVLYAD